MQRSWTRLIWVFLGIFAFSQPLFAQHREDRERARAAYTRGQELFKQGKYPEAEASFQEAYDAMPNAVVLLSISESRERRGDVVGALEALERYLVERPNGNDRARTERRMQKLREQIGTLVIRTNPTGASVIIDGQSTSHATPAQIRLPAGPHNVELVVEGYRAQSKQVTVPAQGEEQLAVLLRPEAPPPPPTEVETPAETSETEPETEEPSKGGPTAAVWVATGVAGAGLVAGTVLGILALSKKNDFNDAPTTKKADDGERLALFADVGFGIAAAGAITAVVLYVTGAGRSSEGESDEGDENATAKRRVRAHHQTKLRLQPAVSSQGGGIAATVQF